MKLLVPGEGLGAMLAALVCAKKKLWDSFHAGGWAAEGGRVDEICWAVRVLSDSMRSRNSLRNANTTARLPYML